MKLIEVITILGGGVGSGCNPAVAEPRCGRPSLKFKTPLYSPGSKTELRMSLDEWTTSDNFIRPTIDALIQNRSVETDSGSYFSASTLLNTLDNSEPFDKPLYRGVQKDISVAETIEAFKVGTIFDKPLISFSSDARVARQFAMKVGSVPLDERQHSRIIFELEAGSKHIDVNKAMSRDVFGEKEHVSGGRFKVTEIEVKRGNIVPTHIYVKIKQLDTFKVDAL